MARKGKTVMKFRRLQAKGESVPFRQANSVTECHQYQFRTARELNLSSVIVFHKLRSLQSLPTAEAKLSGAR